MKTQHDQQLGTSRFFQYAIMVVLYFAVFSVLAFGLFSALLSMMAV